MLINNYLDSHWSIGSEIIPDDINNYFGFIYLITNTLTGKKYIGKKQLKFKKSKIVKSKSKKLLKRKSKKVITYVDSDWKSYTGSCKLLNEDILTLGKSNFKFEILSFEVSKVMLSYSECKQIFISDAVYDSNYYNKNVRICLIV